jgi:nitrite reductase (NAD(P)H)
MADVLSHNLCIDPPEPSSPTSSTSTSSSISSPPDTPLETPQRKSFRRPDLSTKLKLLGVNVASFGDFFADRDGPKNLPSPSACGREVKALSYRDPFQAVYKKYLFTADGKFLLGGMIIGDTADYIKLVGMVKGGKELQVQPSQLILGAKAEGDENPDDLCVSRLTFILDVA